MNGFRHDLAGGNGNLIIDSFQSPNFSNAAKTGWQLTKAGVMTIYEGEIIISVPPFTLTLSGGFIQLGHTGEFSPSEIQENTPGEMTIKSGQTASSDQQASVTWQSADVGVIGNPLLQLLGRTALGVSHDLWLPPSGDPTGATDATVINAALTAGYNVHLMPGATYYVLDQLTIPDYGVLQSDGRGWGIPTGNYGAGPLNLAGAIIKPVAAFTGAVVIGMGAAGTTQHGGQVIKGITIDGSALPTGNGVHGIFSEGYNAGVTLRDVLVWGGFHSGTGGLGGCGLLATNDGTAGHNPDFWSVDHCKFSDCGTWGWQSVGLADSFISDCESTGNGSGGGWSITDGADTRWTGCRANSNGGVTGWAVNCGGGENLQFANCEGNLNGTGWVFSGSGTANIFLSNCIADGNTVAQTSYSGTNVVRTSGGSFSVWIPLALSSAPAVPWTNSGSGPNAEYSWEGAYINVVADLTAGTVTGGTSVFTLPGVLAHTQQLTVMDLSAAAIGRLNVGTGGAATFDQVVGAVATGNRCVISGRLAVDA